MRTKDQHTDRIVDIHDRRCPGCDATTSTTIQTVQKTVEVSQSQYLDRMSNEPTIDVAVNDATSSSHRSHTLTGSSMFPLDASTPGSHDQQSSRDHEFQASAVF